jgi:hypothetical protein
MKSLGFPGRHRELIATPHLLLALAIAASTQAAVIPHASGIASPQGPVAVPSYAVVIDAGSSGSRVNVYAWYPVPGKPQLPMIARVGKENVLDLKVKPGALLVLLLGPQRAESRAHHQAYPRSTINPKTSLRTSKGWWNLPRRLCRRICMPKPQSS